jgi:hypothetical protein
MEQLIEGVNGVANGITGVRLRSDNNILFRMLARDLDPEEKLTQPQVSDRSKFLPLETPEPKSNSAHNGAVQRHGVRYWSAAGSHNAEQHLRPSLQRCLRQSHSA